MSLIQQLSRVINQFEVYSSENTNIELVDTLIESYSASEICACLSDPNMPEFAPERVAILFEIMAWSVVPLEENLKFMDILQNWIETGSERETRYALAVNDWFYYDTNEEMTRVFLDISTRYPQLKTKCDALITERQNSEKQWRKREAERPSPRMQFIFGKYVSSLIMRGLVKRGWKKY